jgi:hypothetical protein
MSDRFHPCAFKMVGAALALVLPMTSAAQQVDLVPVGTYASGSVAGAEIVAHDPAGQRLYTTHGELNRIDVISIADPSTPVLSSSIDMSPYGASLTSVAVRDGLLAAAVANANPAARGSVVLFDTDGDVRRIFEAGVLPDHVSFSADGRYLLVANEGEPVGEFGQPDFVDPPGSITLIDLVDGPDKAAAVQIGFAAFDGREDELRARGVRIFEGRSASADLEPEYIAAGPDGDRAFVSLQEANAFAVIDLGARSIVDIVPAGLKDHSRGLPQVSVHDFPPLPVLGTTGGGQQINLGGFSGLWFEGEEAGTGRLRFAVVPDRGPNGEPTQADMDAALERPFVLPDYQPRMLRFSFDPLSSVIELDPTPVLLTAFDGSTPLTGLPNIAGVDEEPIDLNGNVLAYDPLGADLEGLVIAPNGDLWMSDEYRPAIYRFSANGQLLDRYVPQGTGALGGQAAGFYGEETLPAEYSLRRPNRGFEAIALDTASGLLFAFIQTPLANPNTAASNASRVIRMLGIDPADGSVEAEYVYLIDKPAFAQQNTDKIGDAVFDAQRNSFYIVERDDSTERYGKKMLFEFNLSGATNLRAAGAPALLPGLSLEQHTPAQLRTAGIRPLQKRKVANLPSLGYFAGDKLEGLALLPDGSLAVVNDNDFGIAPQPIPLDGTVPLDAEPTPVQLGILRFALGSGIDASDRDGPAINIAQWPVFGMHMPDSIAAFEHEGETFYASAGEGDDRGEVERISGLSLDPVAFPNAAALQANAQLGRLNASTIDGNLDEDAQLERLQVLGSRSMAVWDRFGNLVYDSGDLLELITADRFPADFNADNEENESFDSRSDNKGPEPEALAVGRTADGRSYAFVGLERIGGIAVFDVTDPYAVQAVGYANRRDFSVTVDLDNDPAGAGDLGPEGIVFIAASDSPNGRAMIAVANEISGTTTLFEVRESLFGNGFESP